MSAGPSRKRIGKDTNGVPPKKSVPITFDGSDPSLHDVVIIVEEDKKFYCLKKELARHSEMFHGMFFSNFNEKDKDEVNVGVVTSEGFQQFLELINGFGTITDDTVEEALTVARYLLAVVPEQKCIEFLMTTSGKTLREKLRLADKFQLEEIITHICSNIKTIADLSAVVPYEDIDLLSNTTKVHVLRISYSLHGISKPKQANPGQAQNTNVDADLRAVEGIIGNHELKQRLNRIQNFLNSRPRVCHGTFTGLDYYRFRGRIEEQLIQQEGAEEAMRIIETFQKWPHSYGTYFWAVLMSKPEWLDLNIPLNF